MMRDTDHDHRQDHGPAGEGSHGDKPSATSAVAIPLVALGLLAAAVPAFGHTAGEELSSAASAFLGSLNAEQKAKATFGFDDAERTNWIFVPSVRKGLPLKEMNPGQRHFAQAILSVALSGRGHMKAEQIMALEQLLLEIEKGSGPSPSRFRRAGARGP